MNSSLAILEKYWGFLSFRPLQQDIIDSVISGKDTIALLPTGGGKSICFQVPALAMEGVCVVISPLIALMNDQVNNLNKRGIKSIAIHSALSKREIDLQLDNCVFGDIKFIYVSPERIKTDIFKERVKRMNISLVAVDEAHCISEWGYDFRPSYLEISELRELLPDVGFIALTASATPQVVDDIADKLLLKDVSIFQKSFKRENLSYLVYFEENKRKRLIRILSSVNGSVIIYVRSRKATKEYAQFLSSIGISSSFYNGGLDHLSRKERQHEWMTGKIRVMVCTNAFGMGIDKPDVRLVIHLDLPETMEAYYQEAGRAGRDGKRSYAVILHDEADKISLERRFDLKYPPKEFIASVYEALGNYLRVAIGAGLDSSLPLNFEDFLYNYNLNPSTTFSSVKILEKLGLISWIDAGYVPSRLMVTAKRDEVYKFQVENKKYQDVLQYILRSHQGVFQEYTDIDERRMSGKLGLKKDVLANLLDGLARFDIIDYRKQSKEPKIVYLRNRVKNSEIFYGSEIIESKKKIDHEKIKKMIGYVENSDLCRSQSISIYFGEKGEVSGCGICDICIEKKRSSVTSKDKINLVREIQDYLKHDSMKVSELLVHFTSSDENNVMEALRWMIDQGMIEQSSEDALKLTS